MRVPYVADLASGDDPESCVSGGDPTVEALTGGSAGQVLSREMQSNFGVPTPWTEVEGMGDARRSNSSTRGVDRAWRLWTLRGRRPCCMYPSILRGNREIPSLTKAGILVRFSNSEEVT